MGVPVVAMVDTKSDPSLVTIPIPANDDAPRSVKCIIDFLAEAAERGKAKRQANQQAGVEVVMDLSSEAPGLSMETEEDLLGEKRGSKRVGREAEGADKRSGIMKPKRTPYKGGAGKR